MKNKQSLTRVLPTVRVSEELYSRLDAASTETRIPKATLVREALEYCLDKMRR